MLPMKSRVRSVGSGVHVSWTAPRVSGGAVYTSPSQRGPRPRRSTVPPRLAGARLALLLILAHAPLALAWGPQGHRTVGAIADRLLTAQTRAAVSRLLADDRDKFGNPSGRTTLEEVSVWSDEIYGTPAARPRWHYDNAPGVRRARDRQRLP